MQGEFDQTDSSTPEDTSAASLESPVIADRNEEPVDEIEQDEAGSDDADPELVDPEDVEPEDADDTTEAAEEPEAAPVPPAVVSPWNCSICGEPSRDICVACTKDTCENHL